MSRNRIPLLLLIIIFLVGIIVGMALNAPVEVPRNSFARMPTSTELKAPSDDKFGNSAFTRIAQNVVKSVVTINTEKESRIGLP